MDAIEQFNLSLVLISFMFLVFLGWIGWLTTDLKWARTEGKENRKRIKELEATVTRLDKWAHDPVARDMDLGMEGAMLDLIRSGVDHPVVDLEECTDADGKIQIAFHQDPTAQEMGTSVKLGGAGPGKVGSGG